jgi:hypothetical protein
VFHFAALENTIYTSPFHSFFMGLRDVRLASSGVLVYKIISVGRTSLTSDDMLADYPVKDDHSTQPYEVRCVYYDGCSRALTRRAACAT